MKISPWILNDINYASKTLQKCNIHLDEASRALQETNAKMQIYRNDFATFIHLRKLKLGNDYR